MLEQGVLVALGTDSRATNPDLSLLAEMQHVGQSHPTIAPDLIVQMGTSHGARALGLENVCGSIEPGKRADLVTICSDLGSHLTGPTQSSHQRSPLDQQPRIVPLADTRSGCETRFPGVEQIVGFES